jgi:hypothetical protein
LLNCIGGRINTFSSLLLGVGARSQQSLLGTVWLLAITGRLETTAMLDMLELPFAGL